METVALVAATLAAAAVIAVAIGALGLQARARRLLDQVGGLLDSEVAPAVRAWGDAARGVHGATGKLDEGLAGLARIIGRLEHVSAGLEPGSLPRLLMGPAMSKVSGWISGLRRGLGGQRTGGEGAQGEGPQEGGT